MRADFSLFAARPKKYKQWKTANTEGNIISYTTVITKFIAYLESPDLSGTLGIIIYFYTLKPGSTIVLPDYSSSTCKLYIIAPLQLMPL